MVVNSIIKDLAQSFVGQQEIAGNQGFRDKEFEANMQTVGWEKGHSWCAYFVEYVWRLAYAQYDYFIQNEVEKLFSAGAVATWNNFNRAGWECNNKPATGALVVWQNYRNGKAHWTGHIGIVTLVEDGQFFSIEGNTNSAGGREGIEVAEKLRPLDFSQKQRGLVLKGFIHPKH